MDKDADAEGFGGNIHFRAPGRLVRRLNRIGQKRMKKLPEMGREALLRFVEEQERELGLPPLQSVSSEGGAV